MSDRRSRNLELKARCADYAHAETVLGELGATREWSLRQVDTYFVAPRGRLNVHHGSMAGRGKCRLAEARSA